MRGFVRECTRFSLCGLNCALCTMQLEERRAILDELLRDYNDGRRKTLYSTAACLLSLGSLREAVEQLRSSEAPESERAKLAATLLNAAAAAEGQSLKLRKKG